MANNKPVEGLPVASTLTGTEIVYLVQGGNSRQSTVDAVAARAATVIFSGALVNLAADATAQDYTTETFVPFDAEVYDTDGFHDSITNNTRLTTQTGNTRVRVGCGLHISNLTAGDTVRAFISKNGATVPGPGDMMMTWEVGLLTETWNSGWSAPLIVVGGTDQFQLSLLVEDSSVTIESDSWFAIEVIE